MPIDDWFARTVVFVVGQTQIGAEPLATGFVVRVSEVVELDDGDTAAVHFHYVVTAAHCVRGQSATAIRVPTGDSGWHDVAIPQEEWDAHPTEDVAIARVPGYWTEPSIHEDVFSDASGDLDENGGPKLGDRVYFIGLLPEIPDMGRRNIPMVRSGTLGARYVQRVPVNWGDAKNPHRVYVEAHLIDCRSYQGFSGSPCFIQFDHGMRNRETGALTGIASTSALLGVVVAHFQSAEHPNLHSGVGVVAPVEKIRELLMSDSEKQWRRAEAAALVAQHVASQPMAVADSFGQMESDEAPQDRDSFLADLTKVTRPVDEPGQASS